MCSKKQISFTFVKVQMMPFCQKCLMVTQKFKGAKISRDLRATGKKSCHIKHKYDITNFIRLCWSLTSNNSRMQFAAI